MVLVGSGFVWNEDARLAVEWRCGMVGGDDCGWWCGVRLLRMGVWLERCRDGSYAINTLRYDVWVIGACLPVCIVACFVGFGVSVFGTSASIPT